MSMDLEIPSGVASMEKQREAVKKGAARLDRQYPGWRFHVDPDLIEPMCPVHSVTGQLFGEVITDQLQGAGFRHEDFIGDDGEDMMIYREMAAFAEHGFAVMTAEPKEVPLEARELFFSALGITLPAVFPAPRDRDVVMMEDSAFTYLWQIEVRNR